jgi:hypothetical protein
LHFPTTSNYYKIRRLRSDVSSSYAKIKAHYNP